MIKATNLEILKESGLVVINEQPVNSYLLNTTSSEPTSSHDPEKELREIVDQQIQNIIHSRKLKCQICDLNLNEEVGELFDFFDYNILHTCGTKLAPSESELYDSRIVAEQLGIDDKIFNNILLNRFGQLYQSTQVL
jgi:hypothetical protein